MKTEPEKPIIPVVDCEQAKELYNKGVNLSDFSETESTYYKKAISLCPDFYKAHYNLGLIYKKGGKFEDAVKEFKDALRIKQDFAEAHFSLALIYDESNKFEDAAVEYQEAIKHKPDFINAHYNLGGIYWMQKKWDLVIKEMEETLKIKPEHKLAKELLEKAKKKLETP
ncbi:MAG: tetratricopeptide repeat protein [Nitrospinae bacterium]|nr:tetratricopeptide repeat protein [Nitrospinota bacterium]